VTTRAPSSQQVRDAWEAVADGFDRHVTPRTLAIGEELVGRLGLAPGTRVIDVGAGSGAVSLPAARAGADVLAVDVAPGMLRRLTSRARDEGLATLRAELGDGTALASDDDSFDVAVSLNAVSLFPDPVAGIREMARVTRTDGQVVVALFGPLADVEFVGFFLAAVRAVAPDRLPPSGDPLPPFRLAAPDRLRGALEGLGLRDVHIDELTWETSFASVDDLLAAIMPSNPIAGQLTAGLTDAQRGQLRQVLDAMLRERAGRDGDATLRTRVMIGQGTV
jgi:ubiquinone/menaquinone biosynthesis C-methylase UbiE